jgi:hypothetical protein
MFVSTAPAKAFTFRANPALTGFRPYNFVTFSWRQVMETSTRQLERRLALVERRMRMTWAVAFVAGVSVLAWGRQPVAQAQKGRGQPD